MVRKDLLQEGWLEISCKNISPAQFIMTIFRPFFNSTDYSHYAHKGGAV